MSKNKRNSSIELLRIFSIFIIIAHHYVYYGVQQSYDKEIAGVVYSAGSTCNRVFSQLMLPGGVVGVDIFFIIMGYFGIRSDKVVIAKTLKKVWFYSLLGLAVYIGLGLLNIIDISDLKKNIVRSIFPVSNGTYWFASVYVILSFIKPAFNRLLMDQKKHARLMIIGAMILYLVCWYTESLFLGIIRGVVLYLIGAEIVLYCDEWIEKKKHNYYFRIFILLMAFLGWMGYVSLANLGVLGLPKAICNIGMYLAICLCGTISAVSFFMVAITGNSYNIEIINCVAESVFPAYLIHENPLLRQVLWSKILKCDTYQYQSYFFPVLAFLSVLGVFIFCVLIDKIKVILVDKSFIKGIQRFRKKE